MKHDIYGAEWSRDGGAKAERRMYVERLLAFYCNAAHNQQGVLLWLD